MDISQVLSILRLVSAIVVSYLIQMLYVFVEVTTPNCCTDLVNAPETGTVSSPRSDSQELLLNIHFIWVKRRL